MMQPVPGFHCSRFLRLSDNLCDLMGIAKTKNASMIELLH